MQTPTSNTLHYAIMEAGSKDRPPMLAPGNYVQWKSRIKRYIDTKPNHELIHYCLTNPLYELGWIDKEISISKGSPITRTERFQETYKNVSQEIRDQLNAKAEAVQIILTGIDNDIYSTVDACPNAFYHPQTHPTHYTQNSLTRSQQDATRNRGKAIVNSSQPIYDQEPSMKIYKPTNKNFRTSSNTSRANQDNSLRINRSAGYENQRIGNVAGARETVGLTMVQKSGIQCYTCKEFGHVARECQKPKRAKDAAYHREKMLLCKQEEARIQLNAEQADWRDDTDYDELEDRELEAHYMYMAQLQEVSPDATYSGPIFDDEPLEEINQNDDDNDLANEHELLASLIEKLKCENNENNNRNKFLETSNKVLIEQLKGEIEDFKNKNKSLKSSNNHFKEANNKLSKTNNLLYTDYKKSEAELARRNSREYASQMEIECAKISTGNSKNTIFDEIDRLSREYYYADHMNAILGVYTELDEVTNLQCDYLELLEICEGLETELSKRVIPTTSVSRPQLKSNPMGDRVMRNNSQGKNQEVEDQHRSVKFSKNKTSVTACNDSLNAKTLNVNSACVTCDTRVLNDKHDICVLHSVAKPIKKTVASEFNQKPRNITRKLYERISKACSWWYLKFTPSGYKWKSKSGKENVNPNTSMPLGSVSRTANILEHMTSRCSTVSNTPFFSNSFAARRDYPIHRRLWVLKAHDGKS
nr:hypothetical protein [Tanacetum cinerariifolium]